MKKKPYLEIKRKFNALPEMVFDAFSDPDTMKIWWPETTSFDVDLQVGGKWTIRRRDGEKEYTSTGIFLEIRKPEYLEYTYAMPQFGPTTDIIAISIIPAGENVSEMTFIQKGGDIAKELDETPEGTVSESEKGWQQGFDLMDSFWKDKPKK